MLQTISTDHAPATDLGCPLHKHPGNVRTVSFPFGDAHVFFPTFRSPATRALTSI